MDLFVALQVAQWLNFIHTRFTPVTDDSLTELNEWLATRTFICGHNMTLADLGMYAALSPEMVSLHASSLSDL
jgi:glutathione S-transferase